MVYREVLNFVDSDALILTARKALQEYLGIDTAPVHIGGDPFNAELPLHTVRVVLWREFFMNATDIELSNAQHEAQS